MKSVLTFLLAMGVAVTLSDAHCFSQRNKLGDTKNGCILDGKLYPFGEIERTENCYRCTCKRDVMLCCSLFHTPINYDKNKCKVVFNKESCNYDVVEKSNPSKECIVYSRVG